MTYLVGTDIGTMGTKTVLVDTEGKVLAELFREYGVITPKQGWAEQWPPGMDRGSVRTIKETIAEVRRSTRGRRRRIHKRLYGGSGIPSIGTLNAIRPCLIWADRRATEECRWVEERIGEGRPIRGHRNVIDPYYGYTKMLWIRKRSRGTGQRSTD